MHYCKEMPVLQKDGIFTEAERKEETNVCILSGASAGSHGTLFCGAQFQVYVDV